MRISQTGILSGSARLAASLPQRTGGTSLSVARSNMGAATDGTYTYFVGGSTNESWEDDHDTGINTVDVYGPSLTLTNLGLPYGATDCMGASNGAYAIFGGGYGNYNGYTLTGVFAFSDSVLTPVGDLQSPRAKVGAAGLPGGHVVLAGGDYLFEGRGGLQHMLDNLVDAYDTNLVHSITTLPQLETCPAGAGFAGHYLFADAGYLYALDDTLACTSIAYSGYSSNTGAMAATNNYALYACDGAIYVFDTSLTALTPLSDAQYRTELTGVAAGGFALFAGGSIQSSEYVFDADSVIAIDSTLTVQLLDNLDPARARLAAAPGPGGSLLFAGGYSYGAGGHSDAVDIFEFA